MDEPTASGPDWDAVRRDYESKMSVEDILKKHSISQSGFYRRRMRENWRLQKKRANNAQMLQRMIRDMLMRLRTTLSEPEAALTVKEQLSALRTLQTSLDRYVKHSQKEADAARLALEPSRITDARREEIARRLEGLCRQLRSVGDCEGAE